MLKVEIGGGKYPKGGEWINVDKIHGVGAYQVDFDSESRDVYSLGGRLFSAWELPFADEAVDEIYSSHCLEHVRELGRLLREIVRVCKVGAAVEIRVPAPFSAMAMCYGHVHVIADEQIDHWCKHFIEDWFGGCARRLKHFRTERIPGGNFGEAKTAFPQLTDDQIMRLLPGTSHENRFFLGVIAS